MLEVLGLILSFVGLITIIPQVLNFLRSYLPEHRLKQLDVTLKETIDMLDAATQDGLLNDPTFVSSTRGDLYCLRDVTENLRAIVLSAPGIYQQCVAFTNGLSIRIRKTHEDVKDIRARIAAVSDEARQQLLPKMRSYRDPCNEASETIVHSNLGVVPNGQVAMTHSSLSPQVAMPTPTYSTRAANTLYRPLRHNSSLALPMYTDVPFQTPIPFIAQSSRSPSPLVAPSFRAHSPVVRPTEPPHDQTLPSSVRQDLARNGVPERSPWVPSYACHDVVHLVQTQGQATQQLVADVERLTQLVSKLLARNPSMDFEAGLGQ